MKNGSQTEGKKHRVWEKTQLLSRNKATIKNPFQMRGLSPPVQGFRHMYQNLGLGEIPSLDTTVSHGVPLIENAIDILEKLGETALAKEWDASFDRLWGWIGLLHKGAAFEDVRSLSPFPAPPSGYSRRLNEQAESVPAATIDAVVILESHWVLYYAFLGTLVEADVSVKLGCPPEGYGELGVFGAVAFNLGKRAGIATSCLQNRRDERIYAAGETLPLNTEKARKQRTENRKKRQTWLGPIADACRRAYDEEFRSAPGTGLPRRLSSQNLARMMTEVITAGREVFRTGPAESKGSKLIEGIAGIARKRFREGFEAYLPEQVWTTFVGSFVDAWHSPEYGRDFFTKMGFSFKTIREDLRTVSSEPR